jgi:hypothetical protein
LLLGQSRFLFLPGVEKQGTAPDATSEAWKLFLSLDYDCIESIKSGTHLKFSKIGIKSGLITLKRVFYSDFVPVHYEKRPIVLLAPKSSQ